MGNLCACGDISDKLGSVENETDALKEETATYKAKVEELEKLLKATKKKAQIDSTNVVSDSIHSPLQKNNNEKKYTSPQNELIAMKLRVKELQNLVEKPSTRDIGPDEEVGDWVEVMSPDTNIKNNEKTVGSSSKVTSAAADNEDKEQSKDNKSPPLSPTSVVIQDPNDEEEHSKNIKSSSSSSSAGPKKNNTVTK